MKWAAAEKWIQALKSEKYLLHKEPQFAMRIGSRYDPLGILCDVSGLATWLLEDNETLDYSYDGEGGVLPATIIEWAAIRSGYAVGIAESHRQDMDGYRTLSAAFDAGMPIERIVAYIEQHWYDL